MLDRGRIVERGTHDELLKRPGPYRRLYDAQLREQEEFEQQLVAARAGGAAGAAGDGAAEGAVTALGIVDDDAWAAALEAAEAASDESEREPSHTEREGGR